MLHANYNSLIKIGIAGHVSKLKAYDNKIVGVLTVYIVAMVTFYVTKRTVTCNRAY